MARRRRGWLLLLATVLAVALGGCLSTPHSATESGPLTRLSTKPVTLTWWVLPSPTEYAWAKELADGFHRHHPNITIRLEKSAQVTNLQSVVANSVAHKLPDLILSSDVLTQTEAAKGVLLNVSPYMKAYGLKSSDFLGKIMDLGLYQGKQYVVPRGMDQLVTAYNPALFKKFGVPLPTEGWTWPQFLSAAKKLTRRVGSTQYYAMGSGGNTHTAYPLYVPFMKGWGGALTKDGHTTFADPKVVRGVTELMDFAKKYTPWFAVPPSDPFLAGQAAMEWVQRPVLYGCCITPDRKKWTSSFVPYFVNVPLLPTPEIGAGMAGWAATVDTNHPHEAAAFLMYTLSKEGQEIYSKAAGEVPVRKDLAGSSVWRNQIPGGARLDQTAFVDYTQYQSYPPTDLPIASDAQVAEAITNMLDSIRLGRATPAEALRQADDAVNAALKSARQ